METIVNVKAMRDYAIEFPNPLFFEMVQVFAQSRDLGTGTFFYCVDDMDVEVRLVMVLEMLIKSC